MRTITALIILAAASLAPATAQVFDVPANGIWIKIQGGRTTQWSAISRAHPKTRVDLMSYLNDNGKRISYYLIRSACPDGSRVASYVIKPGNKLGIGINCNDDVVAGTSAPIEEMKNLPPEAAALLKQ